LSYDRKDKDNRYINIFGWRDKDKYIKINLSLEQFWSEFLYFQNTRYRGNMSPETIFIIFYS
jgi:hypothetical protein